jgi:DNA-binding transcriptional LysR family regulator
MLDIEDLMTFVEVADSGGLSSAARRLGVSKSIVSRRLARLEDDLGVQLLARTTRGAALTQAGTTFRDHAARIYAEIEEAREAISPAGELRGRLRITASLSMGPSYFVPVITEMARRFPLLHVHASYNERFVDIVGEGFDCAIRIGKMPDSNLVARCVGSINGKLVASPGYIQAHGAPESPEELLEHEVLMQGTESWVFNDAGNEITVHPKGRFKADNGTALAYAAAAGIGIGVLPESLIADYLQSGALVELLPNYPLPKVGIFVVRPPGTHPNSKVRVFTELLIEHLGPTEATHHRKHRKQPAAST